MISAPPAGTNAAVSPAAGESCLPGGRLRLRSTRRRPRILAVVALFALAITPATRAEAPLTTADIVRFLAAGISERIVLAELENRGFGAPLDMAQESALRAAGATETLVVAVRLAASAATAVVPSTNPAPSSRAPAAPGAGPRSDTRSGGGGPVFSATTRTVRVPVSVVDKKGEPVVGLRPEDFQVEDGGKPQQITLFSGERRALRIAIALDVSGSMENKIRQVEGALRHFINLLEPTDEIMVLTFAGDVRVAQDFTSDRAQLARILDMLQPEGATALFDAAYAAIRAVAPGAAESKAVVLVTDGVDTESSRSFEELRELARRTEVPVFSIGLDGENPMRDLFRGGTNPPFPRRGRPGGGVPGPGRGWPGGGGRPGGWPGGGGGGVGWPGGGGGIPGRGPGGGSASPPAGFDGRALLDLAHETGGRAEIVKGMAHYKPGSDGPVNDDLKRAVESIAMTLRHRYLLGYEPTDGAGGWHSIRVEVHRPATKAKARRGYYSSSPASASSRR